MAVRILLALVVSIALYGCSQPAAPPEQAEKEDVGQAVVANEGILAVSIQDEVDSFTQSVCAEWDVTTMGTSPPEMNCPGY